MPHTASSSAASDTQHSPRHTPQQLQLTWLLKAPKPFEDGYWSSEMVQTWLRKLDVCGLVISSINLIALLVLMHFKDTPIWHMLPRYLCCIVTASLFQVCLILACPTTYNQWRWWWSWGNRLARLSLCVVPICRGNFDVATTLLGGIPKRQPLWLVLAAYIWLFPLMQFQSSMLFCLPIAMTIAVQLVAASLTTPMMAHTPLSMAAIPGLQQVAEGVCNMFRGAFELMLYVSVDQAAMPGVPAARLDAFGTSGPCQGCIVFRQLLLYGNLCCTLLLPVCICYFIELHQKHQFWKLRGFDIVVPASPLLPMPSRPWLSHCLVLCYSLVLLWLVVELLAPWLRPEAGYLHKHGNTMVCAAA